MTNFDKRVVKSVCSAYLILLGITVILALSACQTFNQPVSLDECNLACYPGRVALVVVKHGVCKCADRGSYYGD